MTSPYDNRAWPAAVRKDIETRAIWDELLLRAAETGIDTVRASYRALAASLGISDKVCRIRLEYLTGLGLISQPSRGHIHLDWLRAQKGRKNGASIPLTDEEIDESGAQDGRKKGALGRKKGASEGASTAPPGQEIDSSGAQGRAQKGRNTRARCLPTNNKLSCNDNEEIREEGFESESVPVQRSLVGEDEMVERVLDYIRSYPPWRKLKPPVEVLRMARQRFPALDLLAETQAAAYDLVKKDKKVTRLGKYLGSWYQRAPAINESREKQRQVWENSQPKPTTPGASAPYWDPIQRLVGDFRQTEAPFVRRTAEGKE